MKSTFLLAAGGLWFGLLMQAGGDAAPSFKKIQITDKFWAEGAHYGDFNRDGAMDVVVGPYWYAGPRFTDRHEYYPAEATWTLKKPDGAEGVVEGYEGGLGTKNAYSDNFLTYTFDFNQDGWKDILVFPHPGTETYWYENPKGAEGHWPRHLTIAVADNESPMLQDLTGDGYPEIVCNSGGYFGYGAPKGSDPRQPWQWHNISTKGDWGRYNHGVGVGDVNGDGRMDILEKDGWWEQPPSLDGDPVWKKHPVTFAAAGCQLYAYDVNGDGLNDVITSLHCHEYGLAWYQQMREGDRISFKPHIFMNKTPAENQYGVKFSQPHAIELVDVDGDGLLDILTGKRFWAHGPEGDPEPNAPAVLYWFQLVRQPDGSVDYIPHLIDDNSGVGTQVSFADLNDDTWPDVIVGNKKGAFVFLQQRR